MAWITGRHWRLQTGEFSIYFGGITHWSCWCIRYEEKERHHGWCLGFWFESDVSGEVPHWSATSSQDTVPHLVPAPRTGSRQTALSDSMPLHWARVRCTLTPTWMVVVSTEFWPKHSSISSFRKLFSSWSLLPLLSSSISCWPFKVWFNFQSVSSITHHYPELG